MMIICDEEKNIVMKDDSFIERLVELFFKSSVRLRQGSLVKWGYFHVSETLCLLRA